MKTAQENGEPLCHCGKPLHYSGPALRRKVDSIIERLGTHVRVTVGGRTWRVPRHYIALHGIKAIELPFLGFEEVSILPAGTGETEP